MNKREYLYQLIIESSETKQVKTNKIINTLQKTDDNIKAKILCELVLTGNMDTVKDVAIDNLIEAFKGDINVVNYDIENKETKIDNKINKEDASLLIELEELRKQIKQHELTIKDITKENTILKELVQLTTNYTLIEVPDEDLNELYVQYMKDGTTSYRNAIIIDRIIPKSYYKL